MFGARHFLFPPVSTRRRLSYTPHLCAPTHALTRIHDHYSPFPPAGTHRMLPTSALLRARLLAYMIIIPPFPSPERTACFPSLYSYASGTHRPLPLLYPYALGTYSILPTLTHLRARSLAYIINITPTPSSVADSFVPYGDANKVACNLPPHLPPPKADRPQPTDLG